MAYQRNPGEDLVWNENRGEYVSANCTLTVAVSPNDATVVLTATGYPQVGNTISVPSGTSVTYTVSKTGYTTVTDTVTVTQDQTINVQLSLLYVLTINPTPANAYVVLTATGYTQSGNTIAVPANTSVSYTVHKGGYNTISSTVTVTQTTSVSVTLTTNAIHEISVGGNVYDVYSKGMLNQNGADEYVYNWIGTLQEYNTQNIATLHPDWVCLITDDNPAGESVNIYTKAQIDEMLTAYYSKIQADLLLNNKADKATTLAGYDIVDGADIDISNITNTGKLNILAMIMPDYSRGSDLTVNTEYTATQYGWVVWRCDNTQQGTLLINNTKFGGAGGIANQWADYNSMIAPISPGDTYKATGRTLYRFYPCKGN